MGIDTSSAVEKRRSTYLALISASHGMNHFYQLMIPVIIPLIQVEYGLSLVSATLLISVYNLSYALLQMISSFLSKVIGRKNTIILGLIITASSFLVLSFVNNLILFTIVLFVAGIGGSVYHPNGMPLLSEFYKENRGKAAGFHQAGGSLGSILSGLVIGALVVLVDWRSAIAILTIPGFALALVLWLVLFEPKRQVTEKSTQEKTDKPRKVSLKMYAPSLIFMSATIIYTLGIRGVNSIAVIYFKDGRGVEQIQASLLFSLLQVAGLFSGPLCGKLSDMIGRKKMLTILVVIESLCLYGLVAVPDIFLIIPCIIFGFSSFGLLAITDAFLADITPRDYMEMIFGLNFTLSFFTQVIIPPAYGLISEYTKSLDIGFIILSAVVLLSIPIIYKVKAKATDNSNN